MTSILSFIWQNRTAKVPVVRGATGSDRKKDYCTMIVPVMDGWIEQWYV
jgi:hypothetical protein